MSFYENLEKMGVVLPKMTPPVAAFAPWVRASLRFRPHREGGGAARLGGSAPPRRYPSAKELATNRTQHSSLRSTIPLLWSRRSDLNRGPADCEEGQRARFEQQNTPKPLPDAGDEIPH
jgi:hypothetical protein